MSFPTDKRFEFLNADFEDLQPGETPVYFGFRCRSTGRMCTNLLIRKPENVAHRPSWAWNGNFEAPTFQPSINCQGCWHGYIEDGIFKNVHKQPEPNQG